ncbi:hypothetical protein AAVH_26145 [Aphelenchoides avenae]|nr:hypothetical protein AAVH_26145 [Aphelenchus avenae]
MAKTVVGLLYLLSFMCTVDLHTLSDNDIDRFDAVIDDAADKFLSDEYLYLDDPSPGDYFDNITSAAKVLAGALNEMEPRAGETLHGIKKSLRKWQTSELDDDLHNALIVWCEEFDAVSPFKMSIALMGEQCEAGLIENGSMEQE